MDWSEDAIEDAIALFADIDAEGNGGHDRTSSQETAAMLCPATVPDPLLSDNAMVTEKVPALQLQVPALQLQVPALQLQVPTLQLQATALQAAGERQTLIDNKIAIIDKVSM